MSLYESGYFFEDRSHFGLTGNYYETISLINNALVFFGKDDLQVKIFLEYIKEIESRKCLVHITQKDDKIWTFFISPKSSNLTISQISECRRRHKAWEIC